MKKYNNKKRKRLFFYFIRKKKKKKYIYIYIYIMHDILASIEMASGVKFGSLWNGSNVSSLWSLMGPSMNVKCGNV